MPVVQTSFCIYSKAAFFHSRLSFTTAMGCTVL